MDRGIIDNQDSESNNMLKYERSLIAWVKIAWHTGKAKPDWKLPARILSNGESVLQEDMACFKKMGGAGRLTIRAQRNHTNTSESEWGTEELSPEGDEEEENWKSNWQG